MRYTFSLDARPYPLLDNETYSLKHFMALKPFSPINTIPTLSTETSHVFIYITPSELEPSVEQFSDGTKKRHSITMQGLVGEPDRHVVFFEVDASDYIITIGLNVLDLAALIVLEASSGGTEVFETALFAHSGSTLVASSWARLLAKTAISYAITLASLVVVSEVTML